MSVKLQWVTPQADERLAYMARVSNVKAKIDDSAEKLIQFLLDHKHVSPFEMVCLCVDIYTTRDISHQMIRHHSLRFQEFSQRYSEVDDVAVFAEARIQDLKNRQNSIEVGDKDLHDNWLGLQIGVWSLAYQSYKLALNMGIAKELARKLLPEGLTPTRLYVQGNVRDWLFYISARTYEGAQKEHREIAEGVLAVLEEHLPVTVAAARKVGIVP